MIDDREAGDVWSWVLLFLCRPQVLKKDNYVTQIIKLPDLKHIKLSVIYKRYVENCQVIVTHAGFCCKQIFLNPHYHINHHYNRGQIFQKFHIFIARFINNLGHLSNF